jgi:uncharacterized DUF497 family protein
MQIEFDRRKAAANLKKHGVSLVDAADTLLDPLAFVREDDSAEGEARFVLVGRSLEGRVLVVCYTLRGECVRLISARKATRKEERQYAEGV